jgi:DNA-binding NtrC family response regulator
VRELENAIERMVAMNSGPLLHTADLPSSLQNDIEARKAVRPYATAAASQTVRGGPASGPAREHSTLGPLPSLTEVERTAIIRALEYTKNDRVMAAHLLGIGRTTLYRKLKEYRLTD